MSRVLEAVAITLGVFVGLPVAWAVTFGGVEALSRRMRKPGPSTATHRERGPIADRLHFLIRILAALGRPQGGAGQ